MFDSGLEFRDDDDDARLPKAVSLWHFDEAASRTKKAPLSSLLMAWSVSSPPHPLCPSLHPSNHPPFSSVNLEVSGGAMAGNAVVMLKPYDEQVDFFPHDLGPLDGQSARSRQGQKSKSEGTMLESTTTTTTTTQKRRARRIEKEE